MNCAELINKMNYSCESLGSFGFCVHTPFSYVEDGESVRVFVRELSDGSLFIYQTSAENLGLQAGDAEHGS